MSQEITITIDGTDGKILPESVAEIIKSVFETLYSLDKKSWNVGTRRLNWRISKAAVQNPLVLTAVGEPISEEYGEPPVVRDYLDGLVQIVKKKKLPPKFGEDDVQRARELGEISQGLRTILLSSPNASSKSPVMVTPEVSIVLKKIMARPLPKRTEYGSIEGTLILMANDPQKDTATAKIRERSSNAEVTLKATPDIASELTKYCNRETRVVVYGEISLEGDVPKSIRVETLVALPSEKSLPTL